jgi:hypothetical protein
MDIATTSTHLPNSNHAQHNKQYSAPVGGPYNLDTRRTAHDCLVPTLGISSIHRRRIGNLEAFDADGHRIALTLGIALTRPTQPWLQGTRRRAEPRVTISVRVNRQLLCCTHTSLEFCAFSLIVLVVPYLGVIGIGIVASSLLQTRNGIVEGEVLERAVQDGGFDCVAAGVVGREEFV